MRGAGDPRDRQDRSLPTWLARGLAIGAGIASVTACSILLDWGGYSGGNARDAAAPMACGNDNQCAKVVPGDAGPGWAGPLALYGPDATPPDCSGDGGFAQYFVVDASVTCSACSCSPPVGGSCADPVVTFYADGGCGTPCGQAPLPLNVCVPPMCGTSFDIAAAAPVGGGCASSGGEPTKSPAWQVAARACPVTPTLSAGSCNAGEVCLPTRPATTAPRVCIRFEGRADHCPAGPYQYGPEIFFTDTGSFDDTRGCSSCTCGTPTMAGCDYSVLSVPNLRYDPTCMTPTIFPFGVPTLCQDLGQQGFRVNSTPRFDAGHCIPSGGEPYANGGVTPTGTPTSFCCTAAP